ncbi:MAG: ferredoxin [Candidatus Micrarchaeota archaeon]
MTVKIIHDRNACIGCGACAAICPDSWEMGDDGKSDLKRAKEDGGNFVLKVADEGCNMQAAQSCPVNCIHVEKDGKKEI